MFQTPHPVSEWQNNFFLVICQRITKVICYKFQKSSWLFKDRKLFLFLVAIPTKKTVQNWRTQILTSNLHASLQVVQKHLLILKLSQDLLFKNQRIRGLIIKTCRSKSFVQSSRTGLIISSKTENTSSSSNWKVHSLSNNLSFIKKIALLNFNKWNKRATIIRAITAKILGFHSNSKVPYYSNRSNTQTSNLILLWSTLRLMDNLKITRHFYKELCNHNKVISVI